MSLVALVLCGALLPAQEGARLHFVELDVHGPVRELSLEAAGAGRTHVRAEFFAGERVRLRVPVPVEWPLGVAGRPPTPGARFEGAGSVGAPAWGRVAAGADLEARLRPLFHRPRPVGSLERGPRVAPAALLGVLGVLGMVLAARSRPRVALSLALGGSGLLLVFAVPERGVPQGGVVELDPDVETALWIRGAEGGIVLPTVPDGLEVEPAGTPLEYLFGPREGTLEVRAPGARLFALVEIERPALSLEDNGLGPLSRVWTRDRAGRWSFHGPWSPGLPLPEPRSAPSPPPGWLSAGLPPGRSVLLAERPVGSGPGPWLRVLGP